MAFSAPIDHRIAYHNHMTEQLRQEGGYSSGEINPLTTKEGSPVDSQAPIQMKVTPKKIKGTIRHSLASAVLK